MHWHGDGQVDCPLCGRCADVHVIALFFDFESRCVYRYSTHAAIPIDFLGRAHASLYDDFFAFVALDRNASVQQVSLNEGRMGWVAQWNSYAIWIWSCRSQCHWRGQYCNDSKLNDGIKLSSHDVPEYEYLRLR